MVSTFLIISELLSLAQLHASVCEVDSFLPSAIYIFNFCLFSAVIDLWRLLSRRLKTAKKIIFSFAWFFYPRLGPTFSNEFFSITT